MQNILTVQALTAARQQNFTPFGDARPSYDYVKKGDVIRVSLAVYATGAASLDISNFRARLGSNSSVALLQIDTSDFRGVYIAYTGHLIVDVQARNDFAKLDDVVRLVAGIAQGSGLSVVAQDTRGEFVSRVEDSGGKIDPTIRPPASDDTNSSALDKWFKDLQSSPMSLALIIGGAALLLFAVKRG